MSEAMEVTSINLPVVRGRTAAGVTESGFMGGIEGAERTNRETAMWNPSMGSPDQLINRVKPMADARGRDMALNDGMTHGAVQTHRDSIVGSNYRLNASPSLRVLASTGYRFDEDWSEEFQSVVEARFELLAESDSHWLDASRRMTLTDMVRLAVAAFTIGGEVFASAEWLSREPGRPLKTAIQLFSGSRVSNPNGEADSATLRRGIVSNRQKRVMGYWIREAHPSELYDMNSYKWNYVQAEKPWGRPQILHAMEPLEIGQSRGVADMVAALKDMRMDKTFKDTALQNIVVNASYAAALESELPPDVIYGMMGQNTGGANFTAAIGAFMTVLNQFFSGANNIAIDGAKIPLLPPGVKLNAKALGDPGGLGSDFEESVHRRIASALGLSYEEYARNWKGVSYSGGRMSVSQTGRFVKARKRVAADRTANFCYGLALEEMIARGDVPLPRGCPKDVFYEPLMREAFSRASWIGAGAGQIDEYKETQAALLRIKGGLSTYEKECARLGDDWRETFAQRAREEGIIAKNPVLAGLFSLDAKGNSQGQAANEDADEDTPAKKEKVA